MNTSRIEKILRGAAWPAIVLAAIVAVASIAYAAYAVGHLFIAYVKIDPVVGLLAVLSSVGMAVGLLLVVITTDNQNARGMGAILLLAWVMLTLALVGLDSFMRTNLFEKVTPEVINTIGRVTASLLPALSLAGVIVMAIALHDTTPHRSASAAVAKYVGFMAKAVAIGASIFASAYFGMSRGIDPVLAVLCGALLESAFLWSYFALKKARESQDRFDVVMWSIAVLTFGAFIAAVSVETLSSLAKIDVPLVAALGEVGASLYVSAVGLSLVLTVIVHLLTRAIDDVPGASPAGKPFAIRTADAIRRARAGMGEIRQALTAAPAPVDRQLPAGTAMPKDIADGMSESDARRLVQAVHQPDAELQHNAKPSKVSESGVSYDTTAELVVSPEEGEALMRAHREMLERAKK